jgi:hypothetical protein
MSSFKNGKAWIGVDLDGTLAKWSGWKDGEIGEPVPAMMERVYKWLHTPGLEVKIFTARAAMNAEIEIPRIHAWLAQHGLPELEVTCVKDMFMIELWDDRARQVIPNTGIAVKVSLD